MRWKLIVSIIVLILLVTGSYYFIHSKSKEEIILDKNNKSLEEASPTIVETSQERLKDIGGIVNENGTISPKLRVVKYQEESIVDSKVLIKRGEYLNFNQSVHDVFGSKIFEGTLNNFLKKELLETKTEKKMYYEQKIEFKTPIYLKMFEDKEYLGDYEAYPGFIMAKNTEFLDYVISFLGNCMWEDLEGTFIEFLGREYYIVRASVSPNFLEMFYQPIRVELKEGEILRVEHPSMRTKEFMIKYVDDKTAIIDLNGIILKDYKEGEVHLEEDMNIYVEDIAFTNRQASVVTLVLAPNRLKFTGDTIYFDDKQINSGLRIRFTTSSVSELDEIRLSWGIEEKTFLTKIRSLTIPFFGNINFNMSKTSYDQDEKEYANLTISATKYSMSKV